MTKRRSEADRRARQSQRIGRALRVLCLIQERNGRWNLDSLARELNCSRKTIQRDLAVLEEAGIPYFYDDHDCCYRIRPDFRLSILDRPPGKAAAVNVDDSDAGGPKPPTPEELAERSTESAERILSETQRLVDALIQLRNSLCRSGRPTDSDDREAN